MACTHAVGIVTVVTYTSCDVDKPEGIRPFLKTGSSRTQVHSNAKRNLFTCTRIENLVCLHLAGFNSDLMKRRMKTFQWFQRIIHDYFQSYFTNDE